MLRIDEAKPETALKYRVGIDVGGTKIEGIVLDGQGSEYARSRCATPILDGYGAVVERIAELYRELVQPLEGATHTLGIGTPGSISPATGLLRNCNATQLNGHPLRDDLEYRLRRPFAMANDANCFALAEARLGVAAHYQNVLGLVLGTGVGAGLVVHGQLVVGRNAIAGEWGHMVVDPFGPQCYCGRKGCVERYLSGTALEDQYFHWTGERLGSAQIATLARMGNEAASTLLDRYLDCFAQAVASVVAVLDPEVIVIGGGLASIDELFSTGVDRLHDLVFCDQFETPILRNRLGNAAGVFGAAMIGI